MERARRELDLDCGKSEPVDMVLLHGGQWVVVASRTRVQALSTAADCFSAEPLLRLLGAEHEHEMQAESAAPAPPFVKLAAVPDAPRMQALAVVVVLPLTAAAVFFLATNAGVKRWCVSLVNTPSAADIRAVPEARTKTEVELQEEARRETGDPFVSGLAFV